LKLLSFIFRTVFYAINLIRNNLKKS